VAKGTVINYEFRQLKVTLTLGATWRIVRQRIARVQLSGTVLSGDAFETSLKGELSRLISPSNPHVSNRLNNA